MNTAALRRARAQVQALLPDPEASRRGPMTGDRLLRIQGTYTPNLRAILTVIPMW
jgi:hypothetical protein